jgi:hypothetical protein
VQGGNYNEEMIAVRYATLAALVVWLGCMIAAALGGAPRQVPMFADACGAVVFGGLFVLKFMGPPPRAFVPRVAIVFVMLAVAAYSRLAAAANADPALLTINLALGFVLLTWYVRE